MFLKPNLAAGAVAMIMLAGASSAMASNTLYAINDSSNSLVTINPEAATITVIGSLGATGDFGDLTYDSNHGVAYWAAGRGNNNLYTVNLTTGAATLVGSHGVDDLFGLAYDTGNDTLYGVNTSGDFYSLNTATGAATQIGSNNGVYPGGLAYVAATDTLFETLAGGGNFYTINLANGAATLFSSNATVLNDNGVTWDASRGKFFTDDWSSSIYSFDANGQNATFVMNTSGAYDGIISVGPTGGAVPEPATWAMMLVGFGGLGAMLRRRRTQGALAAG
ncbi:DUF4394 domain-containing protein [Phenylobacterium sp.]|uniref:DUF4394 domain-containing protein n=1 Tax=Phenylobacterium sp. TaxID=1871053 RepID=UPI00374CC472